MPRLFPPRSIRRSLVLLVLLLSFFSRADQIIYTNALQNGWQNWSWATVNLANTSQYHSAPNSISVTANNSSSDWQALYLAVAAMSTSGFTNLSFWINGGAAGGQQVQVQAMVNGSPQAALQIGPLVANSWNLINLSMSALGVANVANFTGFWLQAEGASPVPTFYVDDIVLQSGTTVFPTNSAVTVTVDALASRHPISPLIYGVAFATSNQLADLNAPLNRSGGNSTTRYNWQTNASNHAADWYFESLQGDSNLPGGDGDDFIRDSKNGGAQAMLTIPIIGYVAKLGANSARLASYSIAKYGAQTGSDSQWFPDAGNSISSATSQQITNNNPLDANQLADTNFQADWVKHLTNTWHSATNGGLRFYIMDNEWSLWNSTHVDVHPVGATMDEVLGKFSDYSTMVKGIEPNALVAGPEEWGWPGYFYSGYDQQYAAAHGWTSYPDRAAHGGQEFCAWFLSQLQTRSQAAGKRLIDVFTLHCYPQGGEALSSDISTATQLLRNRSTRQLWDTNYVDQSWIADKVMLIPRMKNWATNYPGTLTGITEYNWGADDFANGATAQADVLGIFGREGLDLATRWTTPNTGTPAYNSFKMFRNYDGNKSTFGDISVNITVPTPDNLAAFSAVRTNDGALTILVINKDLTSVTPASISVANFPAQTSAQVWQLNSANVMARLADVSVVSGIISNALPPQSLTLFVVPSVPPRLQIFGGVPTNLWLNGTAGLQYVIQSSTNLIQWTPFATNILVTNSISIPVSQASSANLFFRAVRQP